MATRKKGAIRHASVHITRPCFHQSQIANATGRVTATDLDSMAATNNPNAAR